MCRAGTTGGDLGINLVDGLPTTDDGNDRVQAVGAAIKISMTRIFSDLLGRPGVSTDLPMCCHR